jgi:hypothetical protein
MRRQSGKGLRARHIVPWLAKRNTEQGSGLGRWRWIVERTFAWLSQFRRLRARYEKRADIHEAFLSRGCALICWRLPASITNPATGSSRLRPRGLQSSCLAGTLRA